MIDVVFQESIIHAFRIFRLQLIAGFGNLRIRNGGQILCGRTVRSPLANGSGDRDHGLRRQAINIGFLCLRDWVHRAAGCGQRQYRGKQGKTHRD